MEQIIFYGAGQYPVDKIDCLKEQGLNPVCFVDADTNKHGTKLLTYDVISLSEALKRYPDYVFYITMYREKLTKVTEYLLSQGIPIDRIKYTEPYEYKLSCEYVRFTLSGNSFGICHYQDLTPWTKLTNYEEDKKRWLEQYNDLCDKLKSGEKTFCDKCEFLKKGVYEANPPVKLISFTTGNRKDICNFKCVYCVTETHLVEDIQDELSTLDYLKKVYEYDKEGYVIAFSNGEITVNKECDEIFEFLEKTGWSINFASNASVYRESIAKLMRTGQVTHICVSNDAGTRDTFYKIKGVDCYDKVCENLIKYADTGVRIILKYLILEGYNDNDADIDGFLDLAERINAAVDLDRNAMPKRWLDLNDNEKYWLERLGKKAIDRNLEVIIHCHVNDRDAAYLEDAFKAYKESKNAG